MANIPEKLSHLIRKTESVKEGISLANATRKDLVKSLQEMQDTMEEIKREIETAPIVYATIVEEEEEEECQERHEFKKIKDLRLNRNKYELYVQWEEGVEEWEPFEIIEEDAPAAVAKFLKNGVPEASQHALRGLMKKKKEEKDAEEAKQGRIFNPTTGRYVKEDGKIGKELKKKG